MSSPFPLPLLLSSTSISSTDSNTIPESPRDTCEALKFALNRRGNCYLGRGRMVTRITVEGLVDAHQDWAGLAPWMSWRGGRVYSKQDVTLHERLNGGPWNSGGRVKMKNECSGNSYSPTASLKNREASGQQEREGPSTTLSQ
ncbi:hypothetical protein E2C01_019399 [Portunus trituberculatus]|uniref:Uncharacterized protein n=1 Tax=Portunus trituberculatus TaxID=210409 RepID=A0A5B7DZB0_PORTR|nr:hypothetical protein [Portunus trituberculatus]